MILDNLHIDNYLKFEHSEINNSTADDNTLIGATKSTDRTLDFTPDDTNSVYVSKAGNDTTGDGTAANPYLTIKKALTAVTATKCNIVIADSGTYVEESQAIDTDCARIVAAIGQTPVIQPDLLVSSSNYHFDTKLDTTGLTATIGSSSRWSGVAALSNGHFVILYDRNGSNQYTYFIIVDENGSVVIPETVVASSNAIQGTICSLESGYFVIAYRNLSSNLINYYVYDNSGTLYHSNSSVACNYGEVNVGRVGGYDNRFVICYTHTSNYTYFFVADINGVQYVAPKQLTTYRCHDRGAIVPVAGGGFVYSFRISTLDDNRWCVVDGSGNILHDGQVLSGYRYCAGSLTDNGILFACGDVNGNISFIEYSLSTYSVITSAQTIYTDAAVDMNEISLVKMSDNDYALAAWTYQSGTGYTVRVLIIANDWTLLSSETINNGLRSMCAYNTHTERLCISMIGVASPYPPIINIKSGFLVDWWTISSSIEFNGLTFDNTEDRIYRFIYASAGSSFKMKWCTIQDVTRDEYDDNKTYPLVVVQSLAATNVIENCKVYNCDRGFQFTSDSVSVKNSLFFTNLVGPAVYVNGAGPGIVINHNTAFNNQIGLELVSNAGTEVIKNSIFSNNQTAVKAETSVLIKNCCVPDPLDNATYDSTSSTLNPLFISDGYVTTMDLHLQSKVLNYAFDSPALGIADDSKDAGCYDVTYTLNPASYTSFVIPKPKTIIPNISTVNKIVNVMQDGSVDVQVDAYQLEISLEWESVLKRYVSNIIKLFMAEGDIRIYFNPATYPTIYEEMKLVTKELPLNSDTYTLTDSGFNKFKLEFVRKFQLSELVD